MHFDRRKFLKATGVLAVAGLAGGVASGEQAQQVKGAQSRKIRVGVFVEDGFPTVDIDPLALEEFERGNREYEIIRFTREEASSVLKNSSIEVYLHPYGSAFPLELFDPLDAYLRTGGKWVNVGGMPLSVPVVFANGTWKQLDRTPQFHKRIGITAGHLVDVTSDLFSSWSFLGFFDDRDGMNWLPGKGFTATGIYALQMPLTRSKYHSDEDGSDGSREIVISSMAKGGADSQTVSSHLRLTHRSGLYRGSIWSFTPICGSITMNLVRVQILELMQYRGSLEVFPVNATLRPGDNLELLVNLHASTEFLSDAQSVVVSLSITDPTSTVIVQNPSVNAIDINASGKEFRISERKIPHGLPDGFYTVQIRVSTRVGILETVTGFWILASPLKLSASPLTVNESHFIRNNLPMPICGTTYMSSVTHRKFLQEPTPDVWDTDFRQMQKAGINMVRTGIWTGWKDITSAEGIPTENILRALEAYLLTAHKYDIPVIFTFFAFLPETWSSQADKTNSFFDPAAIAKQKLFIETFVRRFVGVNNLLWDFINEPSFSSPKQLWSCRPNYDEFEKAAWLKWLLKRYAANSESELRTTLSGVYGLPVGIAIDLPPLEEFSDTNIIGINSQARTVDYRLFAQDTFAEWTRQMVKVVRSSGGTHQLVTVGQDEGATADRPSPHFFGDTLDFTSVHNWWYNNDLVWDNVMTGVVGKPNLIEETGVMYYERADGFPLRTEQEVADLLERKMAISLGAGGAGFIEWIWNTNPYMPSDNEAAIGIHRIDGTAKPEYDALRKYAQFFKEHGKFMEGRRDPQIAVIIPHSNLFSPRNSADEATRKCVRALSYKYHFQIQGISEYSLKGFAIKQNVLFLPAPGILSDQAWEEIIQFVETGGTLVTSGFLESDEHFRNANRIEKLLGTKINGVAVAAGEEIVQINGDRSLVNFSGEKIHRILKAQGSADINSVRKFLVGKGVIYWSPVPVENGDSIEPVEEYYGSILGELGIKSALSITHPSSEMLVLPTVFKDTTLVTIVNESNQNGDVKFTHVHSGRTLKANVSAGRTIIAFLNSLDGKILASMGDIS